jgi:hypothetical protein
MVAKISTSVVELQRRVTATKSYSSGGTTLEPKIASLVRVLKSAGFHPMSASEGHLENGKRPYPWVTISFDNKDAPWVSNLFLLLLPFNEQSSIKWTFTSKTSSTGFSYGVLLPEMAEKDIRKESRVKTVNKREVKGLYRSRNITSKNLKLMQQSAGDLARFVFDRISAGEKI